MTTFYSVNAKMHLQLVFSMVATLMVHPRIMKIHKNLSGDTDSLYSMDSKPIYPTTAKFWKNIRYIPGKLRKIVCHPGVNFHNPRVNH